MIEPVLFRQVVTTDNTREAFAKLLLLLCADVDYKRYNEWLLLVEQLPVLLHVGGEGNREPIFMLLVNALQRLRDALVRQLPTQLTVADNMLGQEDIVYGLLAILYVDHGIQPYVDLIDETGVESAALIALDHYPSMSSTSHIIRNFRIIADGVASELTPSSEPVFIESATKWLVLYQARTAFQKYAQRVVRTLSRAVRPP